MTKFKTTDESNLVQLVFSRLGGYAGVSSITGKKLSTVKQWRYSNNIPLEHLGALAGASKVDAFALYTYVTTHKTLAKTNQKRPFEILQALREGRPTGLDPRIDKILATRYPPEKLDLLASVFTKLQQPFPSQYEYTCAIDASAQALGIKRNNVLRLMYQFSVQRQEFATQTAAKNARREVDARRVRQKEFAVSVIKGTLTGRDAAAACEQNYWQMLRIVARHLAKYPGYTAANLRKTPHMFRLALGNEVAADPNSEEASVDGVTPLSLRLKRVYDEFYRADAYYLGPEDLVHAPFKDKLIALLDGDVSLHALSEMTGIKRHDLIRFFDAQLVPLGFSFSLIESASFSHQLFLSEILKRSRY